MSLYSPQRDFEVKYQRKALCPCISRSLRFRQNLEEKKRLIQGKLRYISPKALASHLKGYLFSLKNQNKFTDIQQPYIRK